MHIVIMATSYVNTALRPQIMQSVLVKSEKQLQHVYCSCFCVCVCVAYKLLFTCLIRHHMYCSCRFVADPPKFKVNY